MCINRYIYICIYIHSLPDDTTKPFGELPTFHKETRAAEVPQMAADRVEDALFHALQPRRLKIIKRGAGLLNFEASGKEKHDEKPWKMMEN